MHTLESIWPIVAGLAAVVLLLVRISFQLGGITEAFRHHVKESDAAFASLDARMTYQERRRR